MYKTVLFDMDGTLLDTLGDLTAAVNYTMRQFDEPEHTIDEIRSFVGNGIIKLLERSIPADRKEDDFDSQLMTYREYYAAHDRDTTKPYEGMVELLKELKKAGIKTGIVSNKHHSAVVDLSEYYFDGLVDAAVGNSPGVGTKPDPGVVYATMEKLGAKKETTLYVGDSDVDAMTAANAGVDCVLVSWGFRPKELLLGQQSKAVVDTAGELRDIIFA